MQTDYAPLQLRWTDHLPDDKSSGGLCYGPGDRRLPGITLARLGTSEPALPHVGLFASVDPIAHQEVDGAQVWMHRDYLYAVLSVDEQRFREYQSPLRAASREAYTTLFRLLAREGYPAPWRFWNYLSDIHGEEAGLERYRQFNCGRQDAFLETGHRVTGAVPAACALGTQGGELVVAVMAGRVPAQAIENPRQVSAFSYPRDYGPRAPTFARANLSWLGDHPQLWLSGTASIVGHQTLHAGDIAEQTRETLRNIHAVLEETRRQQPSADFALADLHFTVYVRHPEHQPQVAALLEAEVGPALNAVYLQADICRANLLVEIEGSAGHPLTVHA